MAYGIPDMENIKMCLNQKKYIEQINKDKEGKEKLILMHDQISKEIVELEEARSIEKLPEESDTTDYDTREEFK